MMQCVDAAAESRAPTAPCAPGRGLTQLCCLCNTVNIVNTTLSFLKTDILLPNSSSKQILLDD